MHEASEGAGARPSPADGRLSPEVRRLTVGPLQSNCFLARLPGRDEAVIVDPGADAPRIVRALGEWGAEPTAILLTHAHMDHVGAVAPLVERYDLPVHLHPADRPFYERASEHARGFGLEIPPPPPPDGRLSDGQRLEAAGLSFEVRHAPGHSPGGCVLVCGDHAFVGDCVFAGSIGRTDLPGGDAETLLRSIRDRILTLPAETVLHTGHGPDTSVEREARTNPFLTGAYGWSG